MTVTEADIATIEGVLYTAAHRIDALPEHERKGIDEGWRLVERLRREIGADCRSAMTPQAARYPAGHAAWPDACMFPDPRSCDERTPHGEAHRR
jgi:hypothetical protein